MASSRSVFITWEVISYVMKKASLFHKRNAALKSQYKNFPVLSYKNDLKTGQIFSSVQPVTRGLKHYCFRTTQRQVSRLIYHCFGRLPGCPVTYWPSLLNYGDEFVQDLHLFPFSPVQIFHVVPLIIHNQDAIIHLTDTSRICIKLYVTTGSFYHTYTNASRNVINWRIWPHFRL